jgi:hypothetical protein
MKNGTSYEPMKPPEKAADVRNGDGKPQRDGTIDPAIRNPKQKVTQIADALKKRLAK